MSRAGTSFYVATDVSGLARDPQGAPTSALTNPGSILAYRYLGR